MDFFNKFELLCKEKGMTPTRVARDIGISQQTVSMWKKRSSTPKYETIKKIADYFDVTVEELLDIDKEFTDSILSRRKLKNTGENKNKIIKELLKEERAENFLGLIDSAERKSDDAILKNYKNVTEAQLKYVLLLYYSSLNRLGRIEAVKRIADLYEIGKYDLLQEYPIRPSEPSSKKNSINIIGDHDDEVDRYLDGNEQEPQETVETDESSEDNPKEDSPKDK